MLKKYRLTLYIFHEHVIKNRIDFIDILKEYRQSVLYRQLDLFDEIGIGERQDFQILRFLGFDPIERLLLRIDAKGESRRSHRQNTILY